MLVRTTTIDHGGTDVTHDFDRGYWESHWRERVGGADRQVVAHPYLEAELAQLTPGTALDAGCGEGAEAVWLAARGWQVTAADISAQALERAAARAASHDLPGTVEWVRADLTTWSPRVEHDLVTTHYAHPAMPQLAFHARVAQWVAPGGTLLIVAHRHRPGDGHGHGHRDGPHDGQPPQEASVTAAQVAALLDPDDWDVVTAHEPDRTVPGREAPLHDVVVRARRRR